MAVRANGALGYQFRERGERLLDGRGGVRRVQLVEVDGVDSEALRATLDRGPQVRPRALGAERIERRLDREVTKLGGDDRLVAPANERLAKQSRSDTPLAAIDVGDVEEGDPSVKCRVYDGRRTVGRLGGRASPAEVVATKPNRRNGEGRELKCAQFHTTKCR